MGVKEKSGAILGYAQEHRGAEEVPIAGNYYLCVGQDPGAIDGISYAGIAQPMELDAFMDMDNLPELFQNVKVRFVFEDGTAAEYAVEPGGSFLAERIPEIPEKDGCVGTWDGLEHTDLSGLLFDVTFRTVYTAYSTVIQSEQTRDNGLPILLAEGMFTGGASVSVTASEQLPDLPEKETLLEAWDISMTEWGTGARFQLPAGTDAADVTLLVRGESGGWIETAFVQDGSYLVFALNEGDSALALTQTDRSSAGIYAAAAVFFVAAAAAVIVRKRKKAAK